MKTKFFIASLILCFTHLPAYTQDAETNQIQTTQGPLEIHPIHHATMALSWNGTTIYVDPNGGAQAFEGLPKADLILITDIHGDHFSTETLQALDTEKATLVVPQAVADGLNNSYKELIILDNGETTKQANIAIKAIPMYNLPQSSDAYHVKGRGNGYLLTIGDKSVYISGDTEGVPEMRSLEDIDLAFVAMNLPYTMDVEQAADAVLDFAPAVVYPYHYSGQDVEHFKKLVTRQDSSIEVRLTEWYPDS